MSSRYTVNFELRGNASSIEATLNRLNNQISQTGRQTRGASREMGLWQRQMLAFGTTARYAFAGGLVFGITSGIKALAQFQFTWGQTMALMQGAQTAGGFQQAQRDIGDLTQFTLSASTRLNTGADQIANAIQMIYSSANPPGGREGVRQVEAAADAITKLGVATNSMDLEQLSTGVLGFSRAMGRGLADVPRFASMMSKVAGPLSMFRGRELAQQIGTIGAAGITGRFTPEEILSITSLVSQGGGSQAVVGRSVAQLARTILFPQTPRERVAYGQAQLPANSQQLYQLGGAEVLLRQMQAVERLGGIQINRSGRSMTDEQLSALGDSATNAQLGISGRGADLAQRFFGRAESRRAFTIMYSILNGLREPGQSLAQAFSNWTRQIRDAGQSTKFLDQQMRIVNTQGALRQLGTTMGSLRLSLLNNLSPALVPVSGVINRGARAIIDHPRVAQVTEGALIATLLGIGSRNMLGRLTGGRIGGGGVARGVASRALTLEALPQLLQGGPTAGTVANPTWVMIHPASWTLGGPTAGGGGGGGGLGWITKLLGGATAARLAAVAGGTATAIGGGLAASLWLNQHPHLRDAPFNAIGLGAHQGIPSNVSGANLYNRYLAMRRRGQTVPDWMQRAVQQAGHFDPIGGILGRGWHSDIDPRQAERNLERAFRTRRAIDTAVRFAGVDPANVATTQVEGELTGNFRITLVDKQGREITVVEQPGVPVKLWPKHGVPTYQGKPGTTRKGQR